MNGRDGAARAAAGESFDAVAALALGPPELEREPEAPRRPHPSVPWVARRLLDRAAVVLAAALSASTVVLPTAADPPVPRTARYALRKGPRELDPSGGRELITLGTLFNIHTGEAFALSDDEPSPAQFSATLADRATGARAHLDDRLLGLLRALARRNPGVRIELVSGYRSPKLNEMLRKKGHHVASHSQHSLGHACDFRLVGLNPAEMKEEVLALGWHGGLGRYDGRTDWFVHADVGPKREWMGQ